jgi:fructose-1-phosphate kinase PfkB-like protein
MSRVTRGWVLVSRGARGALLVNAAEKVCLRGKAPRIRAVNTVGAGDAMLAAVAACVLSGCPAAEWLRHGIAAGCAAARQPAGSFPTRFTKSG